MLSFLENRPNLKLYLKNTSWIVLDKGLKVIITFFINFQIIKSLGADAFGKFSFVISFLSLGIPVAGLGLEQVLSKRIVHDVENSQSWLWTAISLRFLSSIIVYSILFFVSLSLDRTQSLDLKYVFFWIGLSLIFQSTQVIENYFHSHISSRSSSMSWIAAVLIGACFRLYGVFYQKDVTYFAFCNFVEFFIFLSAALIFLKTREPIAFSFQKAKAKDLLTEAWPMVPAGILVSIYMKIDQVLLKEMTNFSEVGRYAAAIRISELTYILPATLSVSVFPFLSRTHKDNHKAFMNQLDKFMSASFWFYILLAISFIWLAEPICNLIYGSKFSDIHQILQVHIFTGFIVAMSHFYVIKYVLDNQLKISFYGTIVGAVANVLLNLFLVPKMGAVGAAWASVISYILPTTAIAIFIDFRIGKDFVRPIFLPLFWLMGKKK